MAFLHNIDPERLEQLYLVWRTSPDRVGADWRAFFEGFEAGTHREAATPEQALKQSGVQSLIYRYRDIGHLLACTDPLTPCRIDHPLLALAAFGLEESDLDTVFHTQCFMKRRATLREIRAVMRETYCRSIGVEFMHIGEPSERQWLIDRMEPVRNRPALSAEEKTGILGKLMEGSLFEEFLHRRFLGQKRFSLEGGETLIPLLEAVVRRAVDHGVAELVLGMSHRGRLNVLASIFRKPYHNIFSEFQDNVRDEVVGEGDVKYHKGFSIDRSFPGGATIHLAIAANPSHLEAVDGVVEGKARARQERLGADGQRRLLPVLIHGDAAFAGQGVVAEIMNMSQLEGYRTGGTIHIVVNNQIGFTTLPVDARSSRYATDVAKIVEAPVFHVHGEDPEAVVHAARLALDYRQQFARDVVVELICYRRHGHNEGDEPYFTQPLMYRAIKDRPPAWRLYAQRLTEEGSIDPAMTQRLAAGIDECLLESVGKEEEPLNGGFHGEWTPIRRDFSFAEVETGVAGETLRELARVVTTLPEDFKPHPKIAALLEKRRDSVKRGEGIDWGTGEALAFASLLREGFPVRLSGQDSRRGTFNHRHSFVYDQETGAPFVPLAQVSTEQLFSAYDSMLSEYAVLAFEYGYAADTPFALTIWEAQFGDFANGAQVVVDQFVVSGETKWDRVSGLVMLLPHGYEGQGAEHSSARIERYLQLCAGNNIQACSPSTPAQFFHLLRRQLKQSFRKPLVVFTPKSLLRHPRCVSSLAELEKGSFRTIIFERQEKVEVVLFCTGKIYFELLERKEQDRRDDVGLVRIEQLYPLNLDLLREACAAYPAARRHLWVQEEPVNMGAWEYIRPKLAAVLGAEPLYAGRPEAPAPAAGSHRVDKEEQEKVIESAFAR